MSKKKEDYGWFGHPSYLTGKFIDTKTAALTDRSKAAKEFKDLVAGLSTPKDQMYLYRTLKVTTDRDGETLTGYVIHVSIGLNSPGTHAEHYADALKRLLKTGRFTVLDAAIDAADDVWDVLLITWGEGA